MKQFSLNAALISTIVFLLGIVGYFLKDQHEKLDGIYSNTRSLPDDVKRIKESELPQITKRLEDHQALLVALASARGSGKASDYEKVLENLLKRVLKAELENTRAGLAKVHDEQRDIKTEISKLSLMVNTQNRIAALAPLVPALAARTGPFEPGERFTLYRSYSAPEWTLGGGYQFSSRQTISPEYSYGSVWGLMGAYDPLGSPNLTFSVTDPTGLAAATRALNETYRQIGLETSSPRRLLP